MMLYNYRKWAFISSHIKFRLKVAEQVKKALNDRLQNTIDEQALQVRELYCYWCIYIYEMHVNKGSSHALLFMILLTNSLPLDISVKIGGR